MLSNIFTEPNLKVHVTNVTYALNFLNQLTALSHFNVIIALRNLWAFVFLSNLAKKNRK